MQRRFSGSALFARCTAWEALGLKVDPRLSVLSVSVLVSCGSFGFVEATGCSSLQKSCLLRGSFCNVHSIHPSLVKDAKTFFDKPNAGFTHYLVQGVDMETWPASIRACFSNLDAVVHQAGHIEELSMTLRHLKFSVSARCVVEIAPISANYKRAFAFGRPSAQDDPTLKRGGAEKRGSHLPAWLSSSYSPTPRRRWRYVGLARTILCRTIGRTVIALDRLEVWPRGLVPCALASIGSRPVWLTIGTLSMARS